MVVNTNTLGSATSPYLLQHRDNPVAWHQWQPDVLELARQQDKPILLSIGYSACHWCHVMARESFADEDTARLMNDMFVNIKVDREERPDLDEIYQTAHQILTGRPGGWPLTAFLCPRTHLPFLVGTYFPKHGNGTRLGFVDLLVKVNDYYHTRGKDFLNTLDQVKDSYRRLTELEQTHDPDAVLSDIPIERSIAELLKIADTDNGGFGSAPKFPLPNNLERLLVAQWDDGNGRVKKSRDGKQRALAREHLQKTLRTMAAGGVYDQVGGGFFRYATDARWTIPHFEKMLYDNGLLLAVYAQAAGEFDDADLAQAAHGIARWAIDEMTDANGAFCGSLDAESSDGEGGYYLWDTAELRQLLDDSECGVIFATFDLDKYPNFNEHWHLHRQRDWAAILDELQLPEQQMQALLQSARRKLQQARRARPAPARDTKILTGWNGLMIRGLAIAARVFDEPEYLAAAQRAVDFIRDNVWINNHLYASWQGTPKLAAYLDDYVLLMDALTECLRTAWRDVDYKFMAALAESLIENFEDQESGGFYFTSHQHEELIFRSKPFFDNVMPAGNGIAAKVFGRMGHLCAEPRYLDCARRTLLSGWGAMLRQPAGHHNLLLGLAEYLHAPTQVLLKGDATMGEWQRRIQREYGERTHCYWIPETSDVHPPELFLLEDNQGLVCVGEHCLEPQDTLEGVLAQLAGKM